MGMWSLGAVYDARPTGLNLVTTGLTLYLDAGNPASYPGSGSTWTDLSGSGNHMTLTGSPTYSTTSGGVLQFNGSQYGNIPGMNYSTTTYTIMAGTRYSGASRGRVITAISNNWLFGHWGSGANNYYAEGWVFNGGVNDTNWRIFAATEDYAGDKRSFYANNTALAVDSTGGAAGFNGLNVGGQGGAYPAEASTCEASFILVYNRLLSTVELTQNFTAFRSRLGV